MLEKDFMIKIAVRAFALALDSILKIIPESGSNISKHFSDTLPTSGWVGEGWILKEFISPVSGCKHRYYHHSSVKEKAPVFLFLHGLFLDGRNFLNISELSDHWTLIAYDFPEESKIYRGDMSDFKYLIDDFLDCLKIEQIFLCGVSFGGGVGIHYAASHPQKVRALILVSTFVMNSNPADRLKSRQLSDVMLKYSDGKLYWLVERALRFAFQGTKNPMSGALSIVHIKKINWYRQVFRSLSTFDGSEEARMIKCPVLGIHGTRDRTVSLKRAHSVPEYISHAYFEKIDKGTHAMMYLQGSLVAEKIRNFCCCTTRLM